MIAEAGVPSPVVSVMVPAYNAARTIAETLNSVYRQRYRPIELTVVNDGSTDETAELVENFRQAHADDVFRVAVVHQANSGLIAGRRRGLTESSGPYLQFLDADDLLHPDKLETCVPYLQEGAEVVVSRTRKFKVLSEVAESMAREADEIAWTEEELQNSTITSNWWHSVGPLFRRDTVLRAGGFPRAVHPVAEELEFHGRVKLLEPRIRYIPQVLNYYRKGNPEAITGSLDRLYRGRVEGELIALELLRDSKCRSAKEWRSLKWMALRTMYQVSAHSADERLQEDAWNAIKAIVVEGGTQVERVMVSMAANHQRVGMLMRTVARARSTMSGAVPS